MIEYVFLIALISGICFMGITNFGTALAGKYSNISNKFTNINNNQTNPDDGSGESEPEPEPLVGEAYALYFEEDHSFIMTRSESPLNAGEIYNSKTITNAWIGIETDEYNWKTQPWEDIDQSVLSVKIEKPIKPVSTAYWFSGFSKCSSITGLENINTSQTTNMRSTFSDFSGININAISNWDVSEVTNMNYMFSFSNISELDVTSWDTSKVTNMQSMFSGCSSLVSIDGISGWNTSQVTDMHMMFQYCYELTELNVSSWDVSKVTDMECMFEYCESLTSVGDLSDWNVTNVTIMFSMFSGCESLTNIGGLSGWKINNVTDMYMMFWLCSSLTTIGDVSSWDTSKVEDMSNMFYNCYKLTVNCSEWDVSKVTRYFYFNDNALNVIPPTWVN